MNVSTPVEMKKDSEMTIVKKPVVIIRKSPRSFLIKRLLIMMTTSTRVGFHPTHTRTHNVFLRRKNEIDLYFKFSFFKRET